MNINFSYIYATEKHVSAEHVSVTSEQGWNNNISMATSHYDVMLLLLVHTPYMVYLCDEVHRDPLCLHDSLQLLQCLHTVHHIDHHLRLVVVGEVRRRDKDTIADVNTVISGEDATVAKG